MMSLILENVETGLSHSWPRVTGFQAQSCEVWYSPSIIATSECKVHAGRGGGIDHADFVVNSGPTDVR